MAMKILKCFKSSPQRDDETNVWMQSGFRERRTEFFLQLYTGTLRTTVALQ
jgi:hypothetical protein